MKNIASLAVGTAAFAALLAFAPPAAARGGFVDPAPPGVGSITYQEYCRDYSYRQRHADRCTRYYNINDHRDYKDKDRDRHHRHHDHDGDTTPN